MTGRISRYVAKEVDILIAGGFSVPISKPFDLLIFGLFGLTRPEDLKLSPHVGEWTIVLFKIVFLVYLFVTVIVLINLLIAMMSDTYQRIQVCCKLHS